jgi:predicted XRE-type DNA-binding protein
MGQNVFRETGFSDEDATVLALETDAAIAIARWIRARFPNSQSAAARELRLGQNEVSAILSGKITRFSLARLIKIARRAGLRLYFDMGDNASDASTTTLMPSFVGVPVTFGAVNLTVPLLDSEETELGSLSNQNVASKETVIVKERH